MPSRLGELEKLGRLGKEGKKQLLMPNTWAKPHSEHFDPSASSGQAKLNVTLALVSTNVQCPIPNAQT
jgi:hypothetical protein